MNLEDGDTFLLAVFAPGGQNAVFGGVSTMAALAAAFGGGRASTHLCTVIAPETRIEPYQGVMREIRVELSDRLIQVNRVGDALVIRGGPVPLALLGRDLARIAAQLENRGSMKEWYTLVWWPEHPYLDENSEQVTFRVLRYPGLESIGRRTVAGTDST